MSISVKHFGSMKDGQEISLYTLTNSGGASAGIINYGGIVVSLNVPNKNGVMTDVVLGCSDLNEYTKPGGPYLGAIIGRYGNRINKGQFMLNGSNISLNTNSNGHHLHGGFEGFDRKVWAAEIIDGEDGQKLELKYLSSDGEENYPGNLDVTVTYSFSDDNELIINYKAISDKDTICNLTNHTYFNLSGRGKILNHQVTINSDYLTVVDDDCIPTGELRPVDGTLFDFRKGRAVGDGLKFEKTDKDLLCGKGYDHNFVLNKVNKYPAKDLEFAAGVYAEDSGCYMEVLTNKPCMQFYTGNCIDGERLGSRGEIYTPRDGLCLETQFAPDSINHPDWIFPVLKAGEQYDFTTIYKFSIK